MENVWKKVLAILLTVLMMASMVSCVSEIEDVNGGNGSIGDTIGALKETESLPKETSTNETAAPSIEAETSATDEITMEEKLCFEYNGIAVAAKKLVYDSWQGIGLRLNIVNDTSKTYTVGVESVIVNDCMVSDFFSCEVAAGKKANDTLYFSSTELSDAGIEEIGKIEIYFYVYDSETYDRVYESECVTIKTSAYESIGADRKDDGYVLCEGKDIKIVGRYVEQYGWLGKAIVLYIENNRNENVIVSCKEMSINGYMVSGWLYESVYAGKYAVTEISISDTDLSDNDIDKIEEFELKFEVYNPNTYNTILTTEALAFTVG